MTGHHLPRRQLRVAAGLRSGPQGKDCPEVVQGRAGRVLACGHVAAVEPGLCAPGLWDMGLCRVQSLFQPHMNVDAMKSKVRHAGALRPQRLPRLQAPCRGHGGRRGRPFLDMNVKTLTYQP